VKVRLTLPFSSLLPEDEGPSVDPSRFRPDTDLYPGHWNPGQKPQPWSLPETAALQAEARAVLGAALAALPDRHRVVVTLRDVEGYSSEEVSSMLGISAGNQRVILHRARGAVRARLESYFADSIPRRAPLDTDTQRASKPPELVSKASESEAAATASPRPARRRSPAARSR
ncbi:MAG: sigma-70 family RNA polymerase sigma factor, partial [Catenulispora sp.]|nr:sigma-70 family RNA polymerase sigma factor [Catenulispora sp.]